MFPGGIGNFFWRRKQGEPTDIKSLLSPVPEWGPAVKTSKVSPGLPLSDSAYTNQAYGGSMASFGAPN